MAPKKIIIGRNTKQRSVILQILRAKSTPLSAMEILNSAKSKLPTLNKTTVYRTLERMERDLLVNSVNIEPGVNHYELRGQEHDQHHHHFICTNCSKIFCLEGCPSELKALIPQGFLMTSHELTIRGVCSRCH